MSKKISFSDLKLKKNTTSELQYWAVWPIIIKFIKQNKNEHWKSASKEKHPKWSPLDQEAQRNFANGKSPF